MRAKNIQAVDLRERANRVNIGAVAPIPAPFSLYIEPTSACNFRCKFCPTGHKHLRSQRPNGVMPVALWNKIVADIGEFGVKLRKVNLYKDGEPLLHKQFPEMVAHMKAADVADEIWTKTNGAPLNPALNERLASCGLDMLGISVNAVSREGFKRVVDVDVDYERFVANIGDLYARKRTFKLYIKIADSGLTGDEIAKFYADFEPVADFVAVEKLHGWSNSSVMDFQLGTRPDTFEGGPLVEKIACPLPFFMLGINWNGTVSLCNEDWAHKTIVGDLNKQSLKEVWNGPELAAMRRMHLEGRRSENPMCANCDYLRTLPDSIDDYRAEILRRME